MSYLLHARAMHPFRLFVPPNRWSDLLKLSRYIVPRPAFVFVNHGEDEVADRWAEHLRNEGYTAAAPYNGSIYQLTGGHAVCLDPGNRERIRKPAAEARDVVRTSPAFERLVNMGKRLLVVIEHNRGGANKDLAKFASQIQALCDKWDR